jgi:phosphohistidine phosphatase
MRRAKREREEEESAMLLYIVRHGIAIDREDPKSPSDPERYLTPEGLRKTREVARGFASLKISPDVFLSSPYVRAMQTAEIFAEEVKFSKSKIKQTDLLLPGADAAAFFRELQRASRSEESSICFGHAPHLDELIAFALGSKKDLTQMKKAGVACLELTRISPPSGGLAWLSTPKILRKRTKRD